MRLGVWRGGGIGDSLLLAPMLRTIRESLPGVEIDLWCWQEAGEILGMAGLCDWWSHWPNGLRLRRPLDAFLGFDINFEALKRQVEVYRIPQVRTFTAWSPQGVHSADWYVHGAHLLLGTPARVDRATELKLAFGHLKRAFAPVRGSVVLHPGASAEFRRWPLDRFHAVVRELERDGHQITPIEWDGTHDWAGSYNPTRSVSFPALGALLTQAALVIANDSAPAHLASMLGTSTIAIFGPYPSWQTGPIGPRTQIIIGSPEIEANTPRSRVNDYWREATVERVLGIARAQLCPPAPQYQPVRQDPIPTMPSTSVPAPKPKP